MFKRIQDPILWQTIHFDRCREEHPKTVEGLLKHSIRVAKTKGFPHVLCRLVGYVILRPLGYIYLFFTGGIGGYWRYLSRARIGVVNKESKTPQTQGKRGRISVIVPSHNYGRYLGQCLGSIFNQTHLPNEVIVIDDASEDNTREVVRKFPEVKYYRVNFKSGNKTRNFGFGKSSSEYVLFFDADDYMHKEFLEKLYEVLEGDPTAAFAYCDRYNVPEGDVSWYKPSMGLYRSQNFDPFLLGFGNYISAQALIRRSFFPGFDEDLRRLQDWDLWLNITFNKGGRGVYVPEPLFFARIHGKGVTAREDLELARSYIQKKYGKTLFPYNKPFYWRLRGWAFKFTDMTGTTPVIRKIKRRLFD